MVSVSVAVYPAREKLFTPKAGLDKLLHFKLFNPRQPLALSPTNILSFFVQFSLWGEGVMTQQKKHSHLLTVSLLVLSVFV